MFVTMFSGSVTEAFFSLTGTVAYSSSVGSVNSQEQSYFESVSTTRASSGASIQPLRQTTLSVPTMRSAASALPMNTLARSMLSLIASRCVAYAAICCSSFARLSPMAAICCFCDAICSVAVPTVPETFAIAKPNARSACSASACTLLWQTRTV